MTEVAYSDPTSFVAACYLLVWGVVAAAIVLSLLELRFWARRARELEAARAGMAGPGRGSGNGPGGASGTADKETARDP